MTEAKFYPGEQPDGMKDASTATGNTQPLRPRHGLFIPCNNFLFFQFIGSSQPKSWFCIHY